MEGIRGKAAAAVDAPALAVRLSNYPQVLVDLGTGDGRFVQHIARTRPTWFVIGVDTCRENLRAASHRAPCNVLYLIADALALPRALDAVATQITINFPWGSLLRGLLDGDAGLLAGLMALGQPGATLDIRLNGGALAEVGWSLAAGGAQVRHALDASGFEVRPPLSLDAHALRTCPTTWAKRLAFGRDPRALYLHARRPAGVIRSPCERATSGTA